jgi:hypothetical protein
VYVLVENSAMTVGAATGNQPGRASGVVTVWVCDRLTSAPLPMLSGVHPVCGVSSTGHGPGSRRHGEAVRKLTGFLWGRERTARPRRIA